MLKEKGAVFREAGSSMGRQGRTKMESGGTPPRARGRGRPYYRAVHATLLWIPSAGNLKRPSTCRRHALIPICFFAILLQWSCFGLGRES